MMVSKHTRQDTYRKSGIYKIYSHDKVYIGSSRCLYRRWSGHKRGLLRNIHFNKKLQSFYNEHGERSLTFEVIEFCSIENLYDKEKYYIMKFNSIQGGFNISAPYKNSGTKLSEEHKRKIREGHRKSKHINVVAFLKNLEKARVGFKVGIESGSLNMKTVRLGFKTSEETKLKQRIAKLGKKGIGKIKRKSSYLKGLKLVTRERGAILQN